MNTQPGIHGPMANLYDVFVDWPVRLSREMPGIIASLQSVNARKILDVGCGTGRHVKALCDAGFDAYGADISPAMLDEARRLLGDGSRFFQWAMGTPPAAIPVAPFDAILCMGNVWPQITGEANVKAAAKSLHDLLRSGGGLLLMGMKAVAIRKQS
ncbi:MAG: class I SAM-dependent methyltransferase, partial [Phycisphaeraceae bacterium]